MTTHITKNWIEDGKLITQVIEEKDIYKRPWVELTGEMLLKAAQASLSPEQYDHFEAMSKHQSDIYDRLAYAIGVQNAQHKT